MATVLAENPVSNATCRFLDTAIPGAASAIFFNHGQCCCAGSRLYVQKSIYDKVVEGVAHQAREIRLGSGFDAATRMGPLVSQEQLERVCSYIDVFDAALPFGGYKESGWGREMGQAAVELYTETKAVTTRLA